MQGARELMQATAGEASAAFAIGMIKGSESDAIVRESKRAEANKALAHRLL